MSQILHCASQSCSTQFDSQLPPRACTDLSSPKNWAVMAVSVLIGQFLVWKTCLDFFQWFWVKNRSEKGTKSKKCELTVHLNMENLPLRRFFQRFYSENEAWKGQKIKCELAVRQRRLSGKPKFRLKLGKFRKSDRKLNCILDLFENVIFLVAKLLIHDFSFLPNMSCMHRCATNWLLAFMITIDAI